MELNAWLGVRCRALWSEIRHPESKQFSVMEMLEQQRTELMPMPTAFDGYVERSAKVSSTCLVAVAKNRYSVARAALHRAGTAQALCLEKRRTLCRHARAITAFASRADAHWRRRQGSGTGAKCVPSHGLEAVLVAVELVIESGVLSTEHVLNGLARLNAPPIPETVGCSLHLAEAPVPIQAAMTACVRCRIPTPRRR